jgi:hypothetical protein
MKEGIIGASSFIFYKIQKGITILSFFGQKYFMLGKG